MSKVLEGNFSGKNKKIAIVLSRFNSFFVERLLEGALDGLERHEVLRENITIVRAPGAFELPLVCKKIVAKSKFDAVIALGAVIRGDTPHFEYVSSEVTKGIAHVSLDSGVPVIFGVLTTDTIEQAEIRVGAKGGNKGFEAAMTALEMINVLESIEKGV